MTTTPTGLLVTNQNWQTPPYLDWAFQHVAELFPTAAISRGTGPVAHLPVRPAPVGEVLVTSPYDGGVASVSEVMGAVPGLQSVATAIGTPAARSSAMGGSCVSRRV